MAQQNVLVKNLHAVETLGSITLLATDKTGTLTQNKMTVVGTWLNGVFFSTGEMGPDTPLNPQVPNLAQLVQACALCCKSKFSESESDQPLAERTILGDATEVGLLRFACQFVNAPDEQDAHRKAFEIPFSSQTKWHLTVHRIDNRFISFVKGAPERVAKMCKSIQMGDQQVPWNEEIEVKFNEAYEHFAIRGRRVLALARQELSVDKFSEDHVFVRDPCDIPMGEFVFIGLVAIMDPPKHGVRKAIAACRTAGIQIVMVTGDHPLTAESIARQIGLISGDTIMDASLKLQKPMELVTEDEYDAVVVHGEKLELLADTDWDRILSQKEIVFARTSPKQKLEIVTRFQKKGHIVGVSGDGVNDSPALKKADLGISMNKTASDVSKEAAEMILLDDDFASIVHGIAEGSGAS
jgi:sodium/potassium-transporting ATPase subunit alpha